MATVAIARTGTLLAVKISSLVRRERVIKWMQVAYIVRVGIVEVGVNQSTILLLTWVFESGFGECVVDGEEVKMHTAALANFQRMRVEPFEVVWAADCDGLDWVIWVSSNYTSVSGSCRGVKSNGEEKLHIATVGGFTVMKYR